MCGQGTWAEILDYVCVKLCLFMPLNAIMYADTMCVCLVRVFSLSYRVPQSMLSLLDQYIQHLLRIVVPL